MTEIYFKAEWKPKLKRMVVLIRFEGQHYEERFTRHEWKKYIYRMRHSNTLRLGGLTLEATGKMGLVWTTIQAIKSYLLAVDEAFRVTGQTEFLRGC